MRKESRSSVVLAKSIHTTAGILCNKREWKDEQG